MGKKSGGDAPTPDPNIGRAALKQAQTGEQWLSFAQDAFKVSTERQKELDALTKDVTNQQLGIAKDQANWAREDRQRYKDVFQPIEDDFINEAMNYATPEKQAEAAAEAKGDVQASAAQAREANLRNAAAMGINPASGRYAGIDRQTEMNMALAEAGAQNQARQTVRDKGLALKADAANMGRGLPSQSAQAMGLGLQAGSGAVGMNQGNQQIYNSSTGIMNAGFGGAMQGYQGQASTLNNLYNSQLSAWGQQQQAAAQSWGGLGSFVGGVAGMFSGGGIFASDKNVKKNKKKIDKGKALEAVNSMPVEEWDYKQGVEDEGRHIGTYAQDFKRATGKGDGRTIATQDAIGITMKAVQDLDDKVDKIAQAVGIGENNKRGPNKQGIDK